MKKNICIILTLSMFFVCLNSINLFCNETAVSIIEKSFELFRGKDSSHAQMTMSINRPNRNDVLSLESWTKGDKLSLSKFLLPAKFKGQGVLINNDSMWTYSAKSGRSIKISNSMKSQGWMGSDASYDDISKSTDTIFKYTHKILRQEKNVKGKTVYIIESIPNRDSAIVWGKEVTAIEVGTYAMQWKEFYDQAGKIVKRFDVLEIGAYKGKPYMKHFKITNLEKEGYTTELKTDSIVLDEPMSAEFFSINNLEKNS